MYMSVTMLAHTRKWGHTRDIFLYLLFKLIYIGNLSISEHRDLIQLKKKTHDLVSLFSAGKYLFPFMHI